MACSRFMVALVLASALVGCLGVGRRPGVPRLPADGGLPIVAADGAVVGDGAVAPDTGAFSEDAQIVTTRDGGDALPDAGRERDAGGPVDAGRRDAGAPPCEVAPGRLAIVEVMVASVAGTDRGEWFEVLNTATCAVDLAGLEIMSPTTTGVPVVHVVTGGLVAPGARFVFALSGDALDNHGLRFDYVYGTGTTEDVFLGNAGDELVLSAGGVEIDRVAWGATGYTRGSSRRFPDDASVAANGDWSLWCDSTELYSSDGGAFYGSPGRPNGRCP